MNRTVCLPTPKGCTCLLLGQGSGLTAAKAVAVAFAICTGNSIEVSRVHDLAMGKVWSVRKKV